MTNASDLSLLQRAKAFDLQVLGLIYDRYSPGIYRYAYRILNDAALAEACVSEVFSQLLQALSSKGKDGHIHDIEIQLFHSAMRWVESKLARTRSSSAAPTHSQADLIGDGPIEAEDLRIALRQLSAEARTMLLLKFLESWDNAQLAALIDTPISSLHEHYQRALVALRRELSPEAIRANQGE